MHHSHKGVLFVCIALALMAFTPPNHEQLTRAAYIHKYLRLAEEVHIAYGIPVSVCLAQSMHESKTGNSELATEAFNFFGMKCKDVGEVGYMKFDDEARESCFRKYTCADSAFHDYGRRIGTNSIYHEAQSLRAQGITDAQTWVVAIAGAGYATDTLYVQKILQIIEKQQLTKYDQVRPGHYEPLHNGAINTSSALDMTADSGSQTDFSDLDLEEIETAFADSVAAVITTTAVIAHRPASGVASTQNVGADLRLLPAPVPQLLHASPEPNAGEVRMYVSPPMMHPVRMKMRKWAVADKTVR
jgi:Mannosyl-glycoprotein endo-beta-N-acetylglucosaminidase